MEKRHITKIMAFKHFAQRDDDNLKWLFSSVSTLICYQFFDFSTIAKATMSGKTLVQQRIWWTYFCLLKTATKYSEVTNGANPKCDGNFFQPYLKYRTLLYKHTQTHTLLTVTHSLLISTFDPLRRLFQADWRPETPRELVLSTE